MTPATTSIREAIVRWERCRIGFNLVLLVIGLWSSWDLRYDFGGLAPYCFWAFVYGVTANAFYSLGCLAEIYFACFTGISIARFRRPLLIVGTFFSAVITVALAFATDISFHGFNPVD
jgi:hypothetical protein